MQGLMLKYIDKIVEIFLPKSFTTFMGCRFSAKLTIIIEEVKMFHVQKIYSMSTELCMNGVVWFFQPNPTHHV